jgi:hypothetical protein
MNSLKKNLVAMGGWGGGGGKHLLRYLPATD